LLLGQRTLNVRCTLVQHTPNKAVLRLMTVAVINEPATCVIVIATSYRVGDTARQTP
jgi:hypothetical protein